MPFPREYTPRKRWVTTLAMWVVLAGTLAVAATLTRGPARVGGELGEPQRLGELSVRLPVEWQVRNDSIPFVRQRLVASQPAGGRLIAVTLEPDPDRFPEDLAMEELGAQGVARLRFHETDFRVGPATGVMVGGDRRASRRRDPAGGVAVAVARLTSAGKMVQLEMHSPQLSRADVALLRRVAAGVELRPAAPATRPGEDRPAR